MMMDRDALLKYLWKDYRKSTSPSTDYYIGELITKMENDPGWLAADEKEGVEFGAKEEREAVLKHLWNLLNIEPVCDTDSDRYTREILRALVGDFEEGRHRDNE